MVPEMRASGKGHSILQDMLVFRFSVEKLQMVRRKDSTYVQFLYRIRQYSLRLKRFFSGNYVLKVFHKYCYVSKMLSDTIKPGI